MPSTAHTLGYWFPIFPAGTADAQMIPVMQCPRLRLTVKSFNIIYERRKMKYSSLRSLLPLLMDIIKIIVAMIVLVAATRCPWFRGTLPSSQPQPGQAQLDQCADSSFQVADLAWALTQMPAGPAFSGS